MVPQHAHAHARPHSRAHAHAAPSVRGAPPHPDPVRIAGISGTLLLNIVALALLLVPMANPGLIAPPEAGQLEMRWIEPRPLPPDPPPPQVEVMPQQPVPPQIRTHSPPRVEAPAIAPVVVDTGPLAATPIVEPLPAGPQAPAFDDPATPAQGMRLEYASAPAPRYPNEALAKGLQGTVLLEVLVDVDGTPIEVRIHQSSGHRVLDASARRHVLRNWRFRPAVRDGQPVQAIGLVPIDFSLERG
ncbi:energy transducer TonB [Luteimonas sp. SJ-92]|uniref:Energy transducer TonB n=1 Tax=Luteimonas salinisoli TaxID=2752307 RepID=A0A853JI14_9GAMM|nr:energy transducer TonB [Luteimonas salinisoli]NZA28068.1 energy transducer TonB [Luteimonas salinisoli]